VISFESVGTAHANDNAGSYLEVVCCQVFDKLCERVR
jgi:hypothetical protein